MNTLNDISSIGDPFSFCSFLFFQYFLKSLAENKEHFNLIDIPMGSAVE